MLSGSGQQSHGAACVVFSYFVVGVPVSVVLAFGKLRVRRMGVLGLVVGRLAGKFTQLVLYAYIAVVRMDWQEQVQRSRRLLRSISLTDLDGGGASPDDKGEDELLL